MKKAAPQDKKGSVGALKNAVRTQISVAIITYCLVVIV